MARLSKKPQHSRDKTSSNKEKCPPTPKKSNNTKDEPKLMNCSIKVKKIKATYETEMDPSTRSVKRAAEKADVQKVTRIPRTIVKPMKYRDGSNDENKKIKLTQLSDSKKQAEKIADKPAVTKKLKQEVAKEIIEQPVAQTRTRAKKDDEKILYQQKAASKQDSNKISIPTVEPASKKNNLKKTKNDDKSPPAKDVPADIPESLPRASRTKIVPLRFRLDEKKPKEMLAPSINPIQVQPKIELKKMQPRIELKKVQPRIQLRKVIVSPEKTVKIVSALEVGFESRNETTPLKKSPAKPILLRTSTKKSPAKLILLRSSTKKSDSIARKLYIRKQPPKMQSLSENLDQSKKPVVNVPKKSEVVKSSKRTLDKAAPQPQSKRLKPTSVSIFNKPKISPPNIRSLITQEKDKDNDEDIYDFNFSQPSSALEDNKSKPAKKSKPRIKPKLKAGNRMQALMQKSTMNIVSGSCSVLHNPDLFKVEKEAIEKSLKTPVREQPRIVPKANFKNIFTKPLIPPLAPKNSSTPKIGHPSPGHDYMDDISPEPAIPRPKRPTPKEMDMRRQLQISNSNKSLVSKTYASPYRINEDINLPTAFYFGLSKDNLPSFSSDSILLPESDESPDKSGTTLKVVAEIHSECYKADEASENQVAESLEILPARKSVRRASEDDIGFDEDYIDKENADNFQPDFLSESSQDSQTSQSILNNSDAENIAPVLHKSPTKKRQILKTVRSPLKTIAVTNTLLDSIMTSPTTIPPSPLALFSYTGTEKPAPKIVILKDQTLPTVQDLAVEQSYNSRKSASFNDMEVEEAFGFDELMSGSFQVAPQEKSLDRSNERQNIKVNLKKLKEYLPSKLKKLEDSPEKRVELSKPDNLFKSPRKATRDIREMFHSTPVHPFKKQVFDDSAPGTSRACIEADKLREQSLSAKSQVEVSTLMDSSEDETDNTQEFEYTEEDLSVTLFDDPSQVAPSKDESFSVIDKTKIKKNYGRKRRRVAFSDAEDEDAISSEEEVETVAKKRKKTEKPDVVSTHEFQKFVRSMNADFEEAEKYKLIVEANIQK